VVERAAYTNTTLIQYRRTDIRNKHLIEGIQPLGTTPAAVESGGDDRNADEEEDDE
jgi:hypothetical protein